MSTTSALPAVVFGALLAFGAASAAAAGLAQGQIVTKVAEAGSAVRSVTENEDDTASCNRARRRLWVEGEGWVVRRITTCR